MINLFKLKNKIPESSLGVTLRFISGKKLEFNPGQYITIHLKDNRGEVSKEGIPYSISSSPFDEYLEITVKKDGLFSSRLHDLKVGDDVGISGPLGQFSPNDTMANVVYFAGGIGVVPFRSIIRSATRLYPEIQFSLFYSECYQKDLAFIQEFEAIKNMHQKFSIYTCITGESVENPNYENKRIDLDLIKNRVGSFSNKHFFLCGSSEFVQGIKLLLMKERVKNDFIYEETY